MQEASEDQRHPVVVEFEKLALELLTQSAVELFSSYDCPLNAEGDPRPTSETEHVSLGAAIGFTGEYVRGMLAIGLDDSIAMRMNPVPGRQIEDADQDWIGELANQLLGRLKNKLLSYNVELALSTPVVVQGTQIRFAAARHGAAHLRFQSVGDFADIWWDAEVDPALQLSEDQAPDVQLEGEMVLF